MEKTKISQTTWFTITMLILVFPVGIYLMWKNKKFNRIARIGVSAFILLILMIGFSGDSDSDSNGHVGEIQEEVDTEDKNDFTNSEEDSVKNDVIVSVGESDSENITEEPTEDITEEQVEEQTDETEENSTSAETHKNPIYESNNKVFKYGGKEYKIIEVDGGDLSGHREANVAVDVGFGDREYWALTNEYGQLVCVIADKVILQDDSTEPVKSNGRYYYDEAKVPGVERDDLDEGHVIADSLGGVSNAYNITPQDSTLNRHGDQAYMEKVIRDAGGCENFIATITYPDTKTQIPSKYRYEYVLKGNKIVDEFENGNPDKVNASLPNKEEPKEETKADKVEETAPSFNEKNELSKIDTNGNGKVTIKEAKAAGYKMPIYSDHWLYKYMDDRDGDGMVGE